MPPGFSANRRFCICRKLSLPCGVTDSLNLHSMKSRLFHHKDPRAASRTGAQSDTDTLSMLSVGAVTLTPEGEITEINARACDELRIRGGGIFHIR